MNIDRYDVEAICSCDSCQKSYVQHVIPTMKKSDNGRWVYVEDFNKLLSQMEDYEEFIEGFDLWDRYTEFMQNFRG